MGEENVFRAEVENFLISVYGLIWEEEK